MWNLKEREAISTKYERGERFQVVMMMLVMMVVMMMVVMMVVVRMVVRMEEEYYNQQYGRAIDGCDLVGRWFYILTVVFFCQA